jgi:bacteriocin-like protein
MEKIMSKTNDTVRELRDDELQKVSGGLNTGSNEVAVEGGDSVRQKKHITKFKFEPTSFEFGLSHSNE